MGCFCQNLYSLLTREPGWWTEEAWVVKRETFHLGHHSIRPEAAIVIDGWELDLKEIVNDRMR